MSDTQEKASTASAPKKKGGLGGLLIGAAALVGGGLGSTFLLPQTATVTRSFEVAAPANSVFTYFATTPEGEKINDSLTVKVVDASAMKVSGKLVGADGKDAADITYTITPAGENARVAVAVAKAVGFNPIARVQGAIGGGEAGKLADEVLKVVEEGSKTLKKYDFSGLSYQVVDLAARPFLYLDASTPQNAKDIKDGIKQSMSIVEASIRANNLRQDGYPTAVEVNWADGKYEFQAGLPYLGKAPTLLIGTKSGVTPGGKAIKVVYEGSEDQVIPTYDRVEALIAAARLEKSGPSFEVYLDDPKAETGSVKREIYHMVSGNLDALVKLNAAATPTGDAAANAIGVGSVEPVPAPAGAPVDPAAAAAAAPAVAPAAAPAAPPAQ